MLFPSIEIGTAMNARESENHLFTLIQCIKMVSRFCRPRYIGYDFLLGPNLVSFNRTVVPYEISKVNFRVETKIVVSMSEEI